MPKRTNLNEAFSASIQTKRAKSVSARSNVQIVFTGIERTILEYLKDDHCHYAAIISPYLSSEPILKACSTLAGCSIITAHDRYLKSKKRMDLFNDLIPLKNARVVTINRGRGRNKTICHQKVIILLDYEKRPYTAIAGSFNITNAAPSNLETVTIYKNPAIAKAYFDEFENIFAISKKFI